MSLVKWVLRYELLDEQSEPKELQVPVITLADLTELVEGLRLLHDNQNGCPLPSYEKDWNKAMADAQRLLAEYEPLLTHLEAHRKEG